MMGLQSWMCWIGWFLYSMIVNVISIAIITFFLIYGISERYPAVFPNCSSGVLFLFLFLYLVNMLSFIFFLSTLFQKPTLGTSVGLMIWLIIGLVGEQFVVDDPNSNKFLRFLGTIMPNVNLKLGYNAIIDFEKTNGLNFGSVWIKPNLYKPYPPMGCVYMTFAITSLIFFLLTWYIENIYPGNYGVGRPWYFPFQRTYWCSNKISDDGFLEPVTNKNEFENASHDMKAGIQIRNLQKKYDEKSVVNGLNFDIYQKQITCLLGHNGAGKTTTMNMITGKNLNNNIYSSFFVRMSLCNTFHT